MPRRTTAEEIGSGLVPTVDFVGRVSELLQQFDHLSTTVERYAKESSEILELVRQRDQRQNEFEVRDDLNAEIERRYRPFLAVEKEVRNFVSCVGEILDYLPADRPALQPIRFEIERLALWKMVAEPWPILMSPALRELKKVRARLREILEECNREKVGPSRVSRQERRCQIVDALQAELHLKGRDALAKHFHIHDSRIHAAIRGDHGHSGPTTEQIILESCRKHGVNIQGWFSASR